MITEKTIIPKPVGVKTPNKELEAAVALMLTHAEWLEQKERPHLANALRLIIAAVPGTKKVVPRNPLMDAVAEACGFKVTEVPPPMWKVIATAVRDIKTVCQDLTPAEIRIRSANYITRWPHRDLTPLALSKWWASCGGDSTPKPLAVRRGDNL